MTTPDLNVDRFRNLLAFFLVGAFISVLPLLVFRTIPTDNKEVIVYMIGQLSGMATMALGFYFTNKVGADALDAKKAENTSDAFKAITATANAGTASAEPQPVIVTNDETAPVPVEAKP